jgi:hypothetical protein
VFNYNLGVRRPAKGWKPDKILRKGMGRVRMRVFCMHAYEGSCCVINSKYRSPAKGWKPKSIQSKGMGRVNMCVFGTAVEEGSQIGWVGI